MTQPQLERLCRTWQRRLRLSDWRVSIAFAPVSEMPDCIGYALIDEAEMTAEVSIREDAPVEPTLIHELTHIRLYPFSDGDPEEPRHEDRERAINLIADCFQAAYPRRGRKAE
jgi:hypothetical protein